MRTAISMVGTLALIGFLAAAPVARAQDICVGDCNNNGMVAINELVLGVNIALDSQSIDACPAFDCQGTGMVPINCLIQGVNNALDKCPGDEEIIRTFNADPGISLGAGGTCDNCQSGEEGCVSCFRDSDCPSGQTCTPEISRTGLFTSALSNVNASLRFPPGPMILALGKPDSNGIAQLHLMEDAVFSIPIIDSTCFCLKLLAEGSSGSIDCDGGTAYDTKVFQASGEGPEWSAEYNLGDPAGPGNGDLRVMGLIERVNVADECATANCAGREYVDPPNPFPFTTTNAIAQKGDLVLINRGEAFSCENFADEGMGALAAGGAITIDPVGDTADTLRFSETQ
jgi:Cys-rich repeat protein